MRFKPSTQARIYTPAIFVALGSTLVFWRHLDGPTRGVIVFAIGCIAVFIALSTMSARRTRRLLEHRERAIEAIRRGEDVSHLFADEPRRPPRTDRHDAA